jgi:hypothetical protein
MGLIHSASKVVFPAGPPHCEEDMHHHARPPVTRDDVPLVPDLQSKVKMANDFVESEFQALLATRYKMKDVAKKAEEEFQSYMEPLEKSCNDTRNALLRVAERTEECEDVQGSELASLFEKRRKSGKKEAIKGCALSKDPTQLVDQGDCKCAAGSEKDGCRGAKITTDHSLLCTHLRKQVLPGMALWRMTTTGGNCHVRKAFYNQALLPAGQPSNFKMPTNEGMMPLMLLAMEPPPKPRRKEAQTERARSFL